MKIMIAIGAIAVILLGLGAVCCVALAWIHYPQGIIKAMRRKKKQKQEEKTMKRELCVPCAVKLADTNEVKKNRAPQGQDHLLRVPSPQIWRRV